MKKFALLTIICVIVTAIPAAHARTAAERIGERVIGNVLSDVITDSIRESRQEAKANRRNGQNTPTAPASEPAEIKSSSNSEGLVMELTQEQYDEFAGLCSVGSLEEFQKKMTYEKISPKAHLAGDNSKTLVKLAASSPNDKIVQYLFDQVSQ